MSENNVEFEDFDITTDHEARKEMIEKSGQLGVPTIDIDGQFTIGFDVDRIKELLKI